MKTLAKLITSGLSSAILSSIVLAQGGQQYLPKGKHTALELTVPSTLTVANHTSTTFDMTMSDIDEFFIYDVDHWTGITGGNTHGYIIITSDYSGGGVYYSLLSTSGNASLITKHYGLTADVSGTPPATVVFNWKYEDSEDPESLLCDEPVSKNMTVTIN
jgi:hypothetical protein